MSSRTARKPDRLKVTSKTIALACVRDIASRTVMVVNTSDGRSIEITNHPLANGGWVATHEDITGAQAYG